MPDPAAPALPDTAVSFTSTVGGIVASRVRKLQHGVLNNRSAEVAALARLRRAAGKRPGEVPEVLQYTFAEEFVPTGTGDEATPAELAAHLSLTLYALHQQAVPARMHREGPGFRLGRSARRLAPSELTTPPHPAVRRFQALITSASTSELAYHSRGLVQLLRSQRIPLDYGLLAQDLLRWQDPRRLERVRLAWGRDFYVRPPLTGDTGTSDATAVSDSKD
ncbi:type I-E CRISPR-associated protein Cse2/CasB [Amycolatopsis lurida]